MDASESTLRKAEPADLPAVMNVLDGANLETDHDAVSDRIERGTVLVATRDDSVVGTLVFDRQTDRIHVDAVAVRRTWRDRGIGTALVEAAAAHGETVIADFDHVVRPFYEALGFDIEPTSDGRLRGVREE